MYSKVRELPGGGPQGSTLGILSYQSQSTSSAKSVPTDQKYKFVDDLTMLDIVNLVSIGISTYNFKYHIASDIGIDQNYISAEKLLSQNYFREIEEWTDKNKMKLNKEKS